MVTVLSQKFGKLSKMYMFSIIHSTSAMRNIGKLFMFPASCPVCFRPLLTASDQSMHIVKSLCEGLQIAKSLFITPMHNVVNLSLNMLNT